MFLRQAPPTAAAQGVRHIIVVQGSDHGRHVNDIIENARRNGGTSERDGEEIFWITFEDDPKVKVWDATHDWMTRCLWEEMRSFALTD